MSAAEAAPAVVPETLLKKRKREERWAAIKSAELASAKSRNAKNGTLIFKRAQQYQEEYAKQDIRLVTQVISLKREAKLEGGFYVEREPKLLMFVVRIRGVNDMHPKVRTIMQLSRAWQIFNGVFMKVNKATVNMLRRVEPYGISLFVHNFLLCDFWTTTITFLRKRPHTPLATEVGTPESATNWYYA